MNIVLTHQVEASEKSAAFIENEFSDEKLRRDHNLAMICMDVQDLAKELVDIFANAGAQVSRWQYSAGTTQPDDDDHNWDALYRRIAIVFEKEAKLIKTVESFGHSVGGKAEFMAAWQELRGIVCFSIGSVRTGMDQIARGEVRSLAEIERELLNLPQH